MDTWRTAIVDAGPTHLRVRGHDVLALMQQATFTDLIFLLHHDRLPSPRERRLLDAILIARGRSRGRRAVMRGRPIGRVRQSTITRRRHRGRHPHHWRRARRGRLRLHGADCGGLESARRDGLSFDDVAARGSWTKPENGTRLPGFGHRVHATIDPRVAVLFGSGGGNRTRRRWHPVRACAREARSRAAQADSTEHRRGAWPRFLSTSACRRWSASSCSSSGASQD